MTEKIVVDLKDARRVYELMEEINDFFHQPMNFESADKARAFAHSHYPEIRELYYHVVYDWLPRNVQEEFLNR